MKAPVAVLPDESLAEQLTVVTPIGKIDPLGGAHVTGGRPAAWVAVAV